MFTLYVYTSVTYCMSQVIQNSGRQPAVCELHIGSSWKFCQKNVYKIKIIQNDIVLGIYPFERHKKVPK